MERTLLQRKVIYGVSGGLIGALVMIPPLLFFRLPRLMFSLLGPSAIFVLLAPPIIMGLFSAWAAEIEHRSHRKLSFVVLSVSYLVLATLGVVSFYYMLLLLVAPE